MKKITALLLAIVMLLGGFVGGYFVGSNDAESYSPYEVVYKSLETMTSNQKISYFEGILNSDTSPAQVKYVMNVILEDNIDNDLKNNVFAKYLNHIQYYMSTYSDFITLYSAVMLNNRSEINYEESSAVNKINDQVLKSIINEIYVADMKIKMPPVMTDGSPYVIVDYDKLESEYGKIYNDATKEYIRFKEIVQNGELFGTNGEYDMKKTGDYIILANNFISEHSNYPLIGDVIYSYILASKMFCEIYNVYEEFAPSTANIELYKTFVDQYPDTPVSGILKEIIKHHEDGTNITMDEVNAWNSQLDSLMG